MHPQDTQCASLRTALLEPISPALPPVSTPGFQDALPSNLNRQPLAGLPDIQFEHKLCQTLDEQFHNVLVQLSLPLQARLLQLYVHSQQTASLTLPLLHLLDLSEDEQVIIAQAAFFHDIGKLQIDEALLDKTTRLTPDEFAVIKCHPAYGANILNQFNLPTSVGLLVYHHHERWDGRGYPDALAEEAIPQGARIIAIADAFDAMTSDRSYQVRRTPSEALDELERCAGTQFDPLLVQVFCASRLIPAHQPSTALSYPANH